MNCERFQQSIALSIYGELLDDERHQLENHLAECGRCREDLEGMEALHRAMSLYPVQEPSANLVARTRMRLEEALDSVPHSSWASGILETFITGITRLQAAPALTASVLVLGLVVGGVSGYRAGEKSRPEVAQQQVPVELDPVAVPAEIANVSSIVRQPNSELVEVHYNRLVPETMHGSLDDPGVRQLLLLGAQSQLNPGVRDNSFDLLADECRAGHQCGDGPIRGALMVALRYDPKPSVRLKALEGLEPYIAEDVRVRDAVLEALMNDEDASVRTQAIGLLAPVEGDSSVRHVLHTVASRDHNPHIRTVSRQVLEQLSQVQ
jgi:hypothetical protein